MAEGIHKLATTMDSKHNTDHEADRMKRAVHIMVDHRAPIMHEGAKLANGIETVKELGITQQLTLYN